MSTSEYVDRAKKRERSMELKVEVEVDRMPINSVSNTLLNPREDITSQARSKARLGFCLGYHYKEKK